MAPLLPCFPNEKCEIGASRSSSSSWVGITINSSSHTKQPSIHSKKEVSGVLSHLDGMNFISRAWTWKNPHLMWTHLDSLCMCCHIFAIAGKLHREFGVIILGCSWKKNILWRYCHTIIFGVQWSGLMFASLRTRVLGIAMSWHMNVSIILRWVWHIVGVKTGGSRVGGPDLCV